MDRLSVLEVQQCSNQQQQCSNCVSQGVSHISSVVTGAGSDERGDPREQYKQFTVGGASIEQRTSD